MQYIKVQWIHNDLDYPVLLYSELDADRWEVRKVEIFHDDRMEYADQDREIGTTGLGEEPVPTLEEIANDPEFLPEEITQDEFEQIWAKALGSN